MFIQNNQQIQVNVNITNGRPSAAIEQKEERVPKIQKASFNALATAAHTQTLEQKLAIVEKKIITIDTSIKTLKTSLSEQYQIVDREYRNSIKQTLPLAQIPLIVHQAIRAGTSLFNLSLGQFFTSPSTPNNLSPNKFERTKKLREGNLLLAQEVQLLKQTIQTAMRHIEALIMLKQNTEEHPDTATLLEKKRELKKQLQRTQEEHRLQARLSLIGTEHPSTQHKSSDKYQAAKTLAYKYLFGEGDNTQTDLMLAKTFFEIASKEDGFTPMDAYHLGRVYFEENIRDPNIALVIHYYKIAADNDGPCQIPAAYLLANLLENKSNEQKNQKEIEKYYRMAAEHPCPIQSEAAYKLGVIYRNRCDSNTNENKILQRKLFQIAASGNIPQKGDAAFFTAFLYETNSERQDLQSAKHYYLMTINCNSSFKEVAAYRLAMLLSQEPLNDNSAQTIKQLYRTTVSRPNIHQIHGAFALAEILYRERNFEEAITYYSQIAQENYDLPHIRLGEIFSIKDSTGAYTDFARAVTHYNKAIESKGPDMDQAIFHLAFLYSSKCLDLVNQSENQNEIDFLLYESERLYKILIQKNTPHSNQAKINLIILFDLVNKRFDKYKEYCEEIIKSKNALYQQEAAHKLADCYQNGRRVARDFAMARKYWMIAEENENLQGTNAMVQLGIIWKESGQNAKKAQHYFKKAAQLLQGSLSSLAKQDPLALYNLGCMYMNGDGIRKDFLKAQEHLEEAFLLTKSNLKFFIIKQLLILNILKKNQENIHFLEEQLAASIQTNREKFCRRIGGEFMLPAVNLPDVEQAYEQADPQIMQKREKIRKHLISELKIQKIIQADQQMPYSYLPEGICQGMVMQFLSSLKRHCKADMRSQVIASAVNFTYRSGVSAVAFQSIHESLNPIYTENPWNPNSPQKVVAETESSLNLQLPENIRPAIIRWIRGRMVDQAVNKIIGLKSGSLLEFGIPYMTTSQQYLSSFMLQPIGCFILTIQTLNGAHALSLVKDNTTVYLWDPSFGLMDCGKDPISFICSFIYDHYNHYEDYAMTICRMT